MTEETNQLLQRIGIRVPKILLPKNGVDMTKWAVVACDQFTSEPEYWQKVEELVGEEPSTVKITLPEVYLESEDKSERIARINETMRRYLDEGVLEEKFEGLVLVKREQTHGSVRTGLLVALDLEKYDFHKGSKTLIRATEGTVESRIPPRLEIRKNALVELPHIMVLINNPNPTLSLDRARDENDLIYDFELMMGGGHIRGWKITDEEEIKRIAQGLEKLISSDGFLFAMGDGNHSLATAKTHWDNLKNSLSDEEKENHPARFALVELVNVHDKGLEFEPIHRVIMSKSQFPTRLPDGQVSNDKWEKLREYIMGEGEEIEMVTAEGREKIRIKNMGSNLAVGNLQILLDKYIEENPETKIDYIHGEKAVEKIVKENNGVGFLLPVMKKEELFPTVEKDGALPRKTFSMGEAEEKRYYVEARKIV